MPQLTCVGCRFSFLSHAEFQMCCAPATSHFMQLAKACMQALTSIDILVTVQKMPRRQLSKPGCERQQRSSCGPHPRLFSRFASQPVFRPTLVKNAGLSTPEVRKRGALTTSASPGAESKRGSFRYRASERGCSFASWSIFDLISPQKPDFPNRGFPCVWSGNVFVDPVLGQVCASRRVELFEIRYGN